MTDRKLSAAQAEIERLKAESEAWKENAEEHRKYGDHVCAQRAELLAENERLSAEYQRVDAELGVFKTTAQALNGRINELERQATRLRGKLTNLRTAVKRHYDETVPATMECNSWDSLLAAYEASQ